MAAAVHHHHHHLLLRLLPPPPRGLRIFFFFSPRPPPLTRLRSSLPALAVAEWEGREDDQFVVVTFYKLVPVEDPRAEVATHLHFLQGRDIHGRIYMNEQGINAQYSGPRKDAMAYADWLRKDNRFSDILVQTSPALSGHAFPRLKLHCKPSLVTLQPLLLCSRCRKCNFIHKQDASQQQCFQVLLYDLLSPVITKALQFVFISVYLVEVQSLEFLVYYIWTSELALM